jgi:hypothetical protein
MTDTTNGQRLKLPLDIDPPNTILKNMNTKTPKIVFGTLVRNTIINRSGVVYEVCGKHAIVKYASGEKSLVLKKNLEVNPTN